MRQVEPPTSPPARSAVKDRSKGLSGSPDCTAISWGKFVPQAEGGKFGEAFVDATRGTATDCGGGAGAAGQGKIV